MRDLVDRVLISTGATVCIGGAAAFWSLQASTTSGSLFPLPALALLDWGILGFVGFITAGAAVAAPGGESNPAPWAIGGALLPLGVIGSLSIGPYVLLSALLFLIGAAWSALGQSRVTGRDLRWLAGGLLGNLALLLLILAVG